MTFPRAVAAPCLLHFSDPFDAFVLLLLPFSDPFPRYLCPVCGYPLDLLPSQTGFAAPCEPLNKSQNEFNPFLCSISLRLDLFSADNLFPGRLIAALSRDDNWLDTRLYL